MDEFGIAAENTEDENEGLKYNGLSIVYFQVFTLADECNECAECKIIGGFAEPENTKYIKRKSEKEVIDNQVFVYSQNTSPVKRYKLEGFSFSITLKDPHRVSISGKMLVEMSIFHNRTVSITYRMVIENKRDASTDEKKGIGLVTSTDSLVTDQLISLISLLIDAEHWDFDKVICAKCGSDNTVPIKSDTDENEKNGARQRYRCERCGAEFYTDFSYGNIAPEIDEELSIKTLYLNSGGVWNRNITENLKSLEADYRAAKQEQPNHTRFKEVFNRYKDCILRIRNDSKCANNTGRKTPVIRKADSAYVYVDIWESFQLDGKYIENEGEETEFISRLSGEHKAELVGLMSLYPSEWEHRTIESYDDVCGKDIAIDDDDLVLANQKVCVVFGAYGVRGEGAGTDWEGHLIRIRKHFHVSWPEYMLILEMLLIKKHTIEYAEEKILYSVLNRRSSKNPASAIEENAKLHLDVTKAMARLDAVKYLKFASHKIMHDRTSERFELEKAREDLADMMGKIDDSLGNIRDSQSVKQGNIMNIVLAAISIISLFQIIFQDNKIPIIEALFGERASTIFANSVIEASGFLFIIGLCLLGYLINSSRRKK